MKLNTKLAGSAAAIVIGSTLLLAAPAQAAQASYEQSSAMAKVVADQGGVVDGP